MLDAWPKDDCVCPGAEGCPNAEFVVEAAAPNGVDEPNAGVAVDDAAAPNGDGLPNVEPPVPIDDDCPNAEPCALPSADACPNAEPCVFDAACPPNGELPPIALG